MNRKSITAVAIALSLAVASVATSAQAQAPSTADQVKTWTSKQWNAAKKEYAKDKEKWAKCRAESKEKKLTGKASWSYLYDCMKG
jgi:uncharacterized low-complexity protein